jgi:plasmid stability protein
MSSAETVQSSEQLVIKLDHDLIEKLRQCASNHGRSTEEEVREILRDAVSIETDGHQGLGSRIAARFRRIGLKEDIPEMRGHPAEPAVFDP